MGIRVFLRGIVITLVFLMFAFALALSTCGGQKTSSTPEPRAESADETGDVKTALVRSEKPVSVPGAFPTSGGVPLLVHLFDDGSYDPDGEIVKWEWNFGDQHEGQGGWHDYTATQGDAWHQYDKPGNRAVLLRVTDTDGRKDVGQVFIEMREGNNANPVAMANADPTEGNAPLTVSFNADGSYDPDGTIVKYEWDFGEGAGFQDFTENEGAAEHAYTIGGLYTAILRITDDDGAMSTANAEIDVNSPPVAVTNADPADGNAPLTVLFSADGSSDSDGIIVKFEWDFDEGAGWEDFSEAEGVAEYTYVSAGTYTAVLRVTDDDGAEDMDSVPIEVSEADGPGDWWMFGRDPKHNRRSPYVGAQTGNLKWHVKPGGAVVSSPAIDAKGAIFVGCSWGYLHRLNPDGTLDWSYDTGGSVNSSPAIGADGTVYVGSANGYVNAINPHGTLRWRYLTPRRVVSSPTIGPDGVIYIGCGYDLHDYGYLYAFNPDGSLRWRYSTGSSPVRSSPAIGDDGTIYVGCRSGYLYAIWSDGTLRWRRFLGSSWGVHSSPAIGSDGNVYVGSGDGCLWAYTANGAYLWKYYTGYRYHIYNSPAIGVDGTIYVGSGNIENPSGGGYLYAIWPNGTLRWRYRTSYDIHNSCPAIGGDGTIYFGCLDHYFYALNPDGTLKWRYQTEGALHASSPAIDENGVVYVGSNDCYLYAFGD